MSQVLGAFGLLDFTMLWPVLVCHAFRNLWTVYSFNFPIFFFSGHGKPWITEIADMEARPYYVVLRLGLGWQWCRKFELASIT
jgi:hypothetical protein